MLRKVVGLVVFTRLCVNKSFIFVVFSVVVSVMWLATCLLKNRCVPMVPKTAVSEKTIDISFDGTSLVVVQKYRKPRSNRYSVRRTRNGRRCVVG